jgi:hypothetical protein
LPDMETAPPRIGGYGVVAAVQLPDELLQRVTVLSSPAHVAVVRSHLVRSL